MEYMLAAGVASYIRNQTLPRKEGKGLHPEILLSIIHGTLPDSVRIATAEGFKEGRKRSTG